MPHNRMPARRQALRRTAALAGLLAGTGLFPHFALASGNNAFDAKTVQDALAALGAGALVESGDVVLAGPEHAEHGAIVPFAISTTLPGVRRLLLLVEKNPVSLIALFEVSARIEPAFSIRAKLAQSSDVFAVAIMNDGRALYARKAVSVTVGSCN
jgi:sulfur-oxidizing protein SoxY